MGLGSLADMQDFADLFLRKVSIRTQILNALKSHTVFLLSDFILLYFYENVYSQYKTEPIKLLQIGA